MGLYPRMRNSRTIRVPVSNFPARERIGLADKRRELGARSTGRGKCQVRPHLGEMPVVDIPPAAGGVWRLAFPVSAGAKELYQDRFEATLSSESR
jgi:hypothetical protein